MKIAVITGSRADWSGLDLCAEALKAAGHSVRVLGPITSQMTDDSLVDVAIASGEAFDCVWRELHGPLGHPDAPTDLVLLAGDRYEILAAAFACYMLRIPIAHIGGGDVTYGSADDAMRNAITALSSLHFVTHHGALDRLVNRLGVPGDRIHWTGSPALDRIRALPPAAFPPIGKLPARFNVLLAYHPDTIPQSEDHLGEILHACIDLSETWGDAIGFYISNPNADAGHLKVSQRLNLFANERSNNATVFGDMQPDAFVQLMRHCNVMIGNSSAGIYEAPSCGLWTINVSPRQTGRPRAESVIDVGGRRERDQIVMAVELCFKRPRFRGPNPFGDGHAVEKIVGIIGVMGGKLAPI